MSQLRPRQNASEKSESDNDTVASNTPQSSVSSLTEESSLPATPNKRYDSDSSSPVQIAKALGQMTFNQWLFVIALIFGGCCSNVFTLESIVRDAPKSGHLITFTQFLFVATEGFIYFFDPSSKYFFLKKPHIPLHRMIIPVALFFFLSVLNNYVWAFRISVPVHIIFRSGGTVITMIFGFIGGKRYTIRQISGVIVLTIGVILATLYGNPSKSSSSSDEKTSSQDSKTYMLGVFILLIGSILGAFQGVVAESTYKKYGRHWRESLFYTHFLSLFFFFPMRHEIASEFVSAMNSQPTCNIPLLGFPISQRVLYLAINGFTQYICVRGVNNLAGHVSALTVTIVLNIRKFVSLVISVYLFGNDLSPGMILGTVLVFAGAFLYSSKAKSSVARSTGLGGAQPPEAKIKK